MPELPEVEQMVLWLRQRLAAGSQYIDREIVGAKVIRGKNYLPGSQIDEMRYSRIERIDRRGKFIVFTTNRGLLVCHNAMSGYWDSEDAPWTFDYVEGKRTATYTDVRVNVGIGPRPGSDPNLIVLRFHDARLFGSLKFYKDVKNDQEIKSLRELGPDPLEDGTMALRAVYDAATAKPGRKIKELLMDQQVISGIGNIYATEACFAARVDPKRPVGGMNILEIERVYDELCVVLKKAFRHELNYSMYLRVYRKKVCPDCDFLIRNEKVGGRSTYFCPNCQS